jgi:hypothetical protein
MENSRIGVKGGRVPESESSRWRVGPQWEGPAPAGTAGRSRTATAGPAQ